MGNVELETKLAIVSASPESVADEIAGLAGIGDFVLRARESVLFHDRYYDTPERDLAAARVALRIRESPERTLVTVKGPDKLTDGGLERFEYEAPWSGESLAAGIEAIGELGVPISAVRSRLGNDAPARLEELGLRVFHERETERRLRDVLVRSDLESVLAELAVDTVSYRFGARSLRHREVEVEQVASGSAVVLSRVTRALAARWTDLTPWSFSKIATAKAIEELIERGLLEVSPGDERSLRPADYHIIAAHLQRAG